MSHLFYPLGVVLIHPKILDGKRSTIFILSLPNIGEPAKRNGVFAHREVQSDFVRGWE